MVIIVSILLAFGIDAWWGERQERAEEREALAQLESDLRANASQLDTVRHYHQRALDASYEILARAGLGGEPLGGASTAELVLHVGSAWNYDPVLGGINSLIQSGKLGILQNDSLRVAIAGWPDIVRDLNGDENQQQANTFDRLRPYLMTRGAMFERLESRSLACFDQLEDALARPVHGRDFCENFFESDRPVAHHLQKQRILVDPSHFGHGSLLEPPKHAARHEGVAEVVSFYESLGYAVEDRISMGKILGESI
jgi:hypothetical protein